MIVRRCVTTFLALWLTVPAVTASAETPAIQETISAGGYHTCALDTARMAWCWGSDGYGQVGNGKATQSPQYSPARVAGERAYVTIAAGRTHTCALDTAGKAWCWGSDRSGEVGDGGVNSVGKAAPQRVVGDRAYATITAGASHTCALDTAGKGWCWGDGSLDGDGTTSQATNPAPVRVTGDRVYTAISAGWGHTCALDTAGKAWCWGRDTYGQIGDGVASQETKSAPVQVAGGRAYASISAGGDHTCALDVAGKAWCWGRDFHGQIGDGGTTLTPKYAPVRAAGDEVFTRISAGEQHTCALNTVGKARCWGLDEFGQVGDGSTNQTDSVFAPVPVAGGRVFAAISSGGLHSCALEATGKARCWGDDLLGQTGGGPSNQDPKFSSVPVAGNRVYMVGGVVLGS